MTCRRALGSLRELGGTDKLARTLADMGCTGLFGAQEQADRIRQIIAEENAEKDADG